MARTFLNVMESIALPRDCPNCFKSFLSFYDEIEHCTLGILIVNIQKSGWKTSHGKAIVEEELHRNILENDIYEHLQRTKLVLNFLLICEAVYD